MMDTVFLFTFWEVLVWIVMAMVWLLVIWIFIFAFGDIIRRRDLSGWGKAGWILLCFIIPLIGPLIYIATRPPYANDDLLIPWAPEAGTNMSPAEEVAYAKQLLDQGTISEKEYEEIKWNATH
jgi:hypothetical protein